MIPRATYRLQFHKAFTFADAARQADYFAALGISHIYASPILTARAGSMHGYDVIDHAQINPELGGEAGFRTLAAVLRAHDLGLIVDIVPNHMAVGGADNKRWLDVLENGKASLSAHFFDIDWDAPELSNKVLAPFLGASIDEALASGDLKLVYDADLGKITFAYYEHRFLLRPEDQHALRYRPLSGFSHADLCALLDRQHFVLTDWRAADSRINWRRFFDITSLAALKAERDDVFEATHAKIFELYAAGLIDGVRADHIDGLADPRSYCEKLRARFDALSSLRPRSDRPAYIIVEKILAADERLPDWPIDGTTGYDFMNEVSALQHAPDPAATLDTLWQRYGKRGTDFEIEETAARREILTTKFAAQLASTARAFHAATGMFDADRFSDALVAIVCALRCYRTYATGRRGVPQSPYFERAKEKVLSARPHLAAPIAAIAEAMSSVNDEPLLCDAIRRFNQLSAPVAAKAVEDTAFYRYGRLLSRNDVGFDPRQITMSVAEFHARMQHRAAALPASMLTTATHDHKRGEDARARLAVLSEIPQLWQRAGEAWFAGNAGLRPAGLDSADEYQLYQTLVGVWPTEGSAATDFAALPDRVSQWCVKYLREAKLRSTWQSPDEAYEACFSDFAKALLVEESGTDFRQRMDAFLAHLKPAAWANSLVQCVLRYTLPGVPDLYQGCEFADFSMVDPDNRRPVDFAARRASIFETGNPPDWTEGHFKQSLIAALLSSRKKYPGLFADGDYRPLAVRGPRLDHAIAFARTHGHQKLVVVAMRHCASYLCGSPPIFSPDAWWSDTEIGFAEISQAEPLLPTPRAASSLLQDVLGTVPFFVGIVNP